MAILWVLQPLLFTSKIRNTFSEIWRVRWPDTNMTAELSRFLAADTSE